MTLPAPTIAYDLKLLTEPPVRDTATCVGWCYGLPPGISSGQWPLSPVNGYPLQHGFTVCVPEQYRARGRDYVALSLFADEQIDAHDRIDEIVANMSSDAQERPGDPDLLPLWTYRLNRHAMEFRMTDAIGRQFVAIWLIEAEFAGPLCYPPDLTGNPLLTRNPPPTWLANGSARAFFDLQVSSYDREEVTRTYSRWHGAFGGIPETGHHAYAIDISVREGDPNVGKPPRDPVLHQGELDGYVPPFSEAEGIGSATSAFSKSLRRHPVSRAMDPEIQSFLP